MLSPKKRYKILQYLNKWLLILQKTTYIRVTEAGVNESGAKRRVVFSNKPFHFQTQLQQRTVQTHRKCAAFGIKSEKTDRLWWLPGEGVNLHVPRQLQHTWKHITIEYNEKTMKSIHKINMCHHAPRQGTFGHS